MALVVCCPCGNPLDCDNLELVVSLTCPRCEREILLELDTGGEQALRMILTVMEGTHWVGERFVMPIGTNLAIGAASGNWLSLDSEDLADVHCRLHVTKQGQVAIEDQNSASGTWIADQRIQRGQLSPQQSLTIGKFRFRLDIQAADGIEAAPPSTPAESDARPLPIMARVRPFETPGFWLISNRFQVARSLMIASACLMGIYHTCSLHLLSEDRGWEPRRAVLAGLVILATLLISGLRVTQARRHFKFAAVLVLVLLAAVDVHWTIPVPAIALLLLAACLMLLITRVPSQSTAILAAFLGIASITTTIVITVHGLISLAAMYGIWT